jgi:hypothetical protein
VTSSQYGVVSPYKMVVYRALVRSVELLEKEETPEPQADPKPAGAAPERGKDGAFYQAVIEDARLVASRRKPPFEGPLYDAEIGDLTVTHSTKKGGKIYGRLVGSIHACFELPPEPEKPTAAEIVEALAAGDSNDEESRPAGAASDATDAARDSVPDRAASAKDPPVPSLHESRHAPLLFLTCVVAIGIGLLSGAALTFLFLLFVLPVLGVRYLLIDLFDDTTGPRIFGAILIVGQLLCLAVLLGWLDAGSGVGHPVAAGGLVLGVFVAGLLPSALPFVFNAGALVMAMLFWHSPDGVDFMSKWREPVDGIDGAAVPRTNSDGSWPRRPPGKAP